MDKATQKAMFSSESNEWETPQGFYEQLNRKFTFTLDPCCTESTAKCDKFFTTVEDGLQQDWSGALSLFEKAKDLEPNRPGVTPGVKDNPSMILIDRCKVMQENPPGDDWDGVYVMTTK